MSKFSEGKGAILWDVVEIDISSLASLDAVSGASKIDAARENGFRILKSEVMIRSEVGGLAVGMSGPGLNVAEVEEAIESDPQSPSDNVDIERTMRMVVPFGVVPFDALVMNLTGENAIKPRWSWPEGQAMLYWVYNFSPDAVTTDKGLSILAKHFGVWLND